MELNFVLHTLYAMLPRALSYFWPQV